MEEDTIAIPEAQNGDASRDGRLGKEAFEISFDEIGTEENRLADVSIDDDEGKAAEENDEF